MKPRIYFKQNFWHLEYIQKPRAFALFGLHGEERIKAIYTNKVSYLFLRWRDALKHLQRDYLASNVVRYLYL